MRGNLRTALPDVAWLASLLALFAVSFAPTGRVWGFDSWATLGLGSRVALLVAAAVAWLLARWRGGRTVAGRPRDVAVDLLVAAGFLGLCWGLRAQAHFLGDGYQSLGMLAAEPPLVKGTAPLTGFLLVRLRAAFGPDSEAAALAAYRALALLSGAVYAVAVTVGTRALFEDRVLRWTVQAGLLFGGASLVLFGYVENYALLVAVTGALSVLGAVATTRAAWWPVVIVLVLLAGLSHVFGWVLLPAVAYLLLRRTPAARALSCLPAWVRLALAGAGLAAVIGVAAALASQDLSLRLRFVPWWPERFTVSGYTLLSAPHLADLANLLFLLAPGTATLIAAVLVARDGSALREPAFRFLAILTVSTSAVALFVDPKLGMARDQDLFSFAGVPWVAATFWLWARVATDRAWLRRFGPLAVVLSLLVLLPRAHALRDHDRALVPFRRYLALDHTRSRNGRQIIVDHWKRLGRNELAREEIFRWLADYEERRCVFEARAAQDEGDIERAIELNRRAIELSPQYFDAYNNLGAALILATRYEESIESLRLALAISPDEPIALTNLGFAYFRGGEIDAAEEVWLDLYRIRPEEYGSARNLARLAQSREDDAGYRRWLGLAADAADAPPEILLEHGNLLLKDERRSEAIPFLERAIAGGADKATVESLRQMIPELRGVR